MNPGDQKFTREELYEKVWSVPATRLAAELGISDVALAKRCKKLNVPKPSPGYWAKIAVGQTPGKEPLPPTRDEIFDEEAQKPIGKTLPIPETTENLHPLAAELLQKLLKTKADYRGCQHVEEPTLPEVAVTKTQVERAAKSVHAILTGVESVGIMFRKSQGSYNPGCFRKGHDRLCLKLEEILVDSSALGRTSTHTRRPWRTDDKVGSGIFHFAASSGPYRSQIIKEWTESDKTPLGQLLAQIVSGIRLYFVDAQKRRVQQAIQWEKQRLESERHWREYQAKEAIRLEEERKQKHSARLRETVQNRAANLLKAAEWWRIHGTLIEYIQACEQRWRNTQQGAITEAQENWLIWARENTEAVSPFKLEYPDPTTDGAFDMAAIPQGRAVSRKARFSMSANDAGVSIAFAAPRSSARILTDSAVLPRICR